MKIILAIVLGSLFGFALYFAGASNSKKLLSMLRLEDISLMKIILFAIGFSSVLLFFANFIGIFDISHLSVKASNVGVILGGLIFGLGFGAVGTCPGTCVAASSSGDLKKAIAAVLGGLAGAFAFSMTYGMWKNIGLFSAMDLGKLTLFNISEKYPSVVNIGFSGLLITGIIFMAAALLLPQRIRRESEIF
ncbi:DUF6691 family protein [Clostridium polynesiense]|uniref:DUF6691 family protein n=1 Tax=Clostridium polynesiense TaxID=1325933 RepID=UPI0005904DE9|nr:DUF6691 family protein [Clostridium polynesiense]